MGRTSFWAYVGAVVLAVAALAPLGARASADLCLRAAAQVARESGVPYNVLLAIARTETGRGPKGDPWPWSINREGEGFIFETREQALRFARSSRDAGRPSFDLGCFQVNFRWHGEHFTSLEQMVNPLENARYAARFLTQLRQERSSWSEAAGAYHSLTPRYATAYRARFDRQLARLGDAPEPPPGAQPGGQSGARSLFAASPPPPPRENQYPLIVKTNGRRTSGSLVILTERP